MEVTDNTVRELVAVAQHGCQFREYAAGMLLAHAGCYGPARREILVSCMARGYHEWPAVAQFLRDWCAQDRRPSREVTKFVPGDHYYALDQKFNSLSSAIDHLQASGYRYSGLREKHVYTEQ